MAPTEQNDLDIESQRALRKPEEFEEDEDDIEKTTAESLLAPNGTPVVVAAAPDGAIKPSDGKSNTNSFLIWTVVNTLATIGIVCAKPQHLIA